MKGLQQRELYAIIISGLGSRPDPRYEAAVQAISTALRASVNRYWQISSVLDDVVQDALLVITAEKVRSVTNPDRFLYWCFRVGQNVARERLRSGRWGTHLGDEIIERIVDLDASADESVLKRERLALLDEAMQALGSISGGKTLYLFAVSGWSYEQIALHLEISEDAARAHVSRARRQLRRHGRLYHQFRNLTDE